MRGYLGSLIRVVSCILVKVLACEVVVFLECHALWVDVRYGLGLEVRLGRVRCGMGLWVWFCESMCGGKERRRGKMRG